ncbi:MAG: hypothetical protein ACFFE2_15265 [Candidatus Thorarchaeota archaeon]
MNITTAMKPPIKKEITDPAAYKQLLVDPFRGMASAIRTSTDKICPMKSAYPNTR